MRKCEPFIHQKGLYLGDLGYKTDKTEIQYGSEGKLVFYHYTYKEHLNKIFAKKSGLYAYRPVSCHEVPTYLQNHFLTEEFLSPIPNWLTNNEYFGNLGKGLVEQFVGNIILRVEVPKEFPSIYIADYAHILECKSLYDKDKKEGPSLNLGYDCSSGIEVTQAYVNSYIPAVNYKGGHIAPIVQLSRGNSGIIIPNEYISVYN
ncbi:hypothetical protein [Bacillus cereus group sp. BfR-BA-01380]|uniref:hypothetical protein n=1 Tax=Bacillus cereus group sp. BfR-BA-01380 TaxID=2920324 RepID=UPI001F567420|nr:hypothetical protein [Bacillus cereus group sp. BfR-BA-01380]